MATEICLCKECLFLPPILIRAEPSNLLELPVEMLDVLISAAFRDVCDGVGGHGEEIAGALNAASYYVLNYRDTEQLLIYVLEIGHAEGGGFSELAHRLFR